MVRCRRRFLLVVIAAGVLIHTILGTPALFGQGGSIYRQVISPDTPTGTGQPAPGATIRVCPKTAVGTPCSPLSPNVYADPTLVVPIGNPFSADANGIYSVFLPTGSYIVQETPVPGVTYSLLVFVNGTGTVSSVGLSLPTSVFGISGSPVTGTGTLTAAFISQGANTVFGNCTGSGALPTFCSLVAGQIPSTLNATNINGLTVTGTSTLNGNTFVSGTLGVTGLGTLGSLSVSGTSALSGGGSIAGTFTGAPNFSGGLIFSGNPSFTGSPTFSIGTPSFTNGAAMAGTFTGAPTFSGNPTFSGTPVFSGTPTFSTGATLTGTFTGNPAFPGNPSFGGTPSFAGDPTFAGNPNFSGDPQAVTQVLTDNDASLATTAFVQNLVGAPNGFAISTTTNGYIKLPATMGGLILQWATGPSNPATGETNFTVNFPIAFPHACLNVQLSSLTPTVIGNSADMLYQVISYTTTSTHIFLQEFSNGRDITTKVMIFAIGY